MPKQNQPTEADNDLLFLRKHLEELHGPRKRIEKLNEPLMELTQRQQNLIDFANRMAAASVIQPTAIQRLSDAFISKEKFGSNPSHIQVRPNPSLSLPDFIASEHKAQQRAIEEQAKANAEAFKIVINDVLAAHSRKTNTFQESLSKKTVFWTVILTAIVTSFLNELYKDQLSNVFEEQNIEQSIASRDVRQYEDY